MKQSTFKHGRADEWTRERIGQLAAQEIMQLRDNAERLNEPDLAALCGEVLAQARSRANGTPRQGRTGHQGAQAHRSREGIRSSRSVAAGRAHELGRRSKIRRRGRPGALGGGDRVRRWHLPLSSLGSQRGRRAAVVRLARGSESVSNTASGRSSLAAPKACWSTAAGWRDGFRRSEPLQSTASMPTRCSRSRWKRAAQSSGRSGAQSRVNHLRRSCRLENHRPASNRPQFRYRVTSIDRYSALPEKTRRAARFGIAEEMGLPLATVRQRLAGLAATGAVVTCNLTRFEDGKRIEGWLCRVSGYIPPAAPGRKPKAPA